MAVFTPKPKTHPCPLCASTGKTQFGTCRKCNGSGVFVGVEILIADQWTSTGNITDFKFDDLFKPETRERISGGDSAAAAAMFGGAHLRRTVVALTDEPTMGSVWYVRGPRGKTVRWKYRYDSSD